MEFWIWMTVAAITGVAIGALGMYFAMPRTSAGRDARALREELDQYREEVAEHFAQTAGLVNRMTDSYKDVFEHLQDGASKLLTPQSLQEKLADQSDEVITIKRLGAPRTKSNTTDATAASDNSTKATPEAHGKVDPAPEPTNKDNQDAPAEKREDDASQPDFGDPDLSPDDRLRQSES